MKIKLTIAAAAMLAASLTASMANAATVDVGSILALTKLKNGYASDLDNYSTFLNKLSTITYTDLSSYFGASANSVKVVQGLDEDFSTWIARLTFTGTAVKSNGFVVDTAALTVSPVAVPGPEAGTGLAAVAMAGLGVLAYRRKQKLAA